MSSSLNDLLNAFSSIQLSVSHGKKGTKEEEIRLKQNIKRQIEEGNRIGSSSKKYMNSEIYDAEICGAPVPKKLTELRRVHEVVHATSCKCRIAKYPFSHGSVRTAYYGFVLMPGATEWTSVILKEFIVPHERTELQYSHQSDNSAIAYFLVKTFSGGQKLKKPISAIRSRILKVSVGGRQVLYNMEEHLKGNFKKWTNNWGNIIEVNKSLMQLAKWSHVVSGGYLLLSDLQGVETDTNIILTDPAVLCVDLSRFGPTNFAPAQMSVCLDALDSGLTRPELASYSDTLRAPGMSKLGDEMLMDSLEAVRRKAAEREKKRFEARIGRGVFTESDGSKYEGELKDDKKHGRGVYTRPDGRKYIGEFKHDKKNGRGVFTWPNGRKYDGELKDDKIHGRGLFTWPDGSKYDGEFKHDKMHGRGVFTWSDGRKYDGEFLNDKMYGRAIHSWPDGSKYDGEFKHDKMHGRGVHTWPDGKKYDGEWKDDKRHGRGVITWPDGRKYDGEWKDCKCNGRGVYTHSDGRKYDGEFLNDKMHGKGVLTERNGIKYDGEWKDDKMHGRGVLTLPDGSTQYVRA